MHCLMRHAACGPSMLQHGPGWVHGALNPLNDSTGHIDHWAPDDTQTRHATRSLQDCTKNHSEDLGEAVPEALKNMLLVMGARGVLKPDWKVDESAAPTPQLAHPALAAWDCMSNPVPGRMAPPPGALLGATPRRAMVSLFVLAN